MKRVELLEELNTTMGHALIIKTPDEVIRIGDEIIDNNGTEYEVKGIKLPATPGLEIVSLFV